MKSRIILSTADFSANNIGRYVELSDLTKKVLAKQTLYDEQSSEAAALNTFLAGLTDNGFIGGTNPLIKYLVIPALANNNDQLLYNIAELDGEGYPTDKRSDAEKAAAADKKVFNLYTGNNVVKGLYACNNSISSSDFITQRKQVLDGFFTKGVQYPPMSVCMWCPQVSSTSGDKLLEIGGGYSFVMKNNIVGLISENTSDRYLKASISGLGTGFVGITCDEANEQITAMFDNGTLGEVQSLNATTISQSNDDSYYNAINFGLHVYDDERKFHTSVIAFGNAMTTEQMTQFKSLLTSFLTSLNIISE